MCPWPKKKVLILTNHDDDLRVDNFFQLTWGDVAVSERVVT